VAACQRRPRDGEREEEAHRGWLAGGRATSIGRAGGREGRRVGDGSSLQCPGPLPAPPGHDCRPGPAGPVRPLTRAPVHYDPIAQAKQSAPWRRRSSQGAGSGIATRKEGMAARVGTTPPCTNRGRMSCWCCRTQDAPAYCCAQARAERPWWQRPRRGPAGDGGRAGPIPGAGTHDRDSEEGQDGVITARRVQRDASPSRDPAQGAVRVCAWLRMRR
jgi:hypothetical protein